MSEENKALARRWFEDFYNAHDPAVADEIVSPDCVVHDPNLPGLPPGPEGSKQTARVFRDAFPDTRITVEDQVAEGDRVVTRWTARGTHQGDLMGIPPSGVSGEIAGVTINRISRGKIAETWGSYDLLGLMRQIGAVP